jgi:large conductance mechanosensitive channel
MKKFFAEFKKFITRGNIVDMSVGVIVGGAFTAIVNGLSNNILKPIINWVLKLVLGKNSLSEIFTFFPNCKAYKDVVNESGEVIGQEIDLANSIYIDWGAFISAVINFLLIAFVLFIIVKFINKLSQSKELLAANVEKARAKQASGKKLSKKELQLIAEDDARIAAEAEAKRIADEEASKPKVTTESLLVEIRDLLAKK